MPSPEADNPFAACTSVAEVILAGHVGLDDTATLEACLLAADLRRDCLMRAAKELRRGQPELAAQVRALALDLPRERRRRGQSSQRWRR
ncbi:MULTISPECIES: hypothetical protein [unclassified Bradyrhizobium]|uniref:hypothetical protein n=1 Tax=unclassified Bradyrhizobium TaxID=2631580 RepID=UPI0028E23D6B|nr:MULTISPECIES: hypothetical protein [unclassified Bradyrhizobium]